MHYGPPVSVHIFAFLSCRLRLRAARHLCSRFAPPRHGCTVHCSCPSRCPLPAVNHRKVIPSSSPRISLSLSLRAAQEVGIWRKLCKSREQRPKPYNRCQGQGQGQVHSLKIHRASAGIVALIGRLLNIFSRRFRLALFVVAMRFSLCCIVSPQRIS